MGKRSHFGDCIWLLVNVTVFLSKCRNSVVAQSKSTEADITYIKTKSHRIV